ncbi:Cof-type HAD-IIB family hydrolase [Mumia sp. zg.B17]|uniref:HAD family hydrolase n=1 Tax=Mumia sp. zg.B17 TaxID=2855446 RepID=UPI001C6F28FE|nr:HAD family hydrolase [Mumia sp. zg.B17]MBW9205515.1 Cof-type HAD-IIB family hydrolase [Mumia sp. zg.B17]
MPDPTHRLSRAGLPAVLATDLDGTLLRSDGSLSPRTREAIARAEESGVPTVFVTARPPRWLDAFADAVGDATGGVALSANGAFVYHVASRTVTDHGTIAPGLLRDLGASLREALPGIALAVERADGMRREEAFAYVRESPEADDLDEWDAIASQPAGKLLAKLDGSDPDEFHRRVAAVLDGRAELGFSGAVGLAEITAPGVTKASGLAAWCAGNGFDRESVWAVGDMPNDLPMLRWASRSFAVANAHHDVLDTVDEVVPSNDDDGVAAILDRICDEHGALRRTP